MTTIQRRVMKTLVVRTTSFPPFEKDKMNSSPGTSWRSAMSILHVMAGKPRRFFASIDIWVVTFCMIERASDLGQKVSKECTGILDDFRVGKLAKPVAFMEIYQKLVRAGLDNTALASTMAIYQGLFESHERLEASALAKGNSSLSNSSSAPPNDAPGDEGTAGGDKSQSSSSPGRKKPSTAAPKHVSAQQDQHENASGEENDGDHHSEEGQGGDDEEDSDTDESSSHRSRDADTDTGPTLAGDRRKRRRLADSGFSGNEDELFPFLKRSELRTSTLPPELQKTRAQYAAWADDYKLVESLLFGSSDRPELPKSQWKRLVRNQAVDLDKVLTSITAVRSDDKYKELVGERITIQITGDSVPTRRVESHSDWTIAFARVADGMVYLQPHRQQELRKYGEYINALFSVHQPHSHKAIINYDQAIRKRVQDRGDLMLSDLASFWDLKDLYLSATGANSGSADSSRFHSGQSSKSRSGAFGKTDEICKRHNENKCPSRDGRSCRYRHACLQCGAEGHISRDCTNSSKSK
ncbi:hypothetical protein SCHPADRAFT_31759 [Schizopora paradoxa]|uniref:CCHC-type domain-containing protein n=1 Tax=Schizopora paradoxa TaxID=27342 RepID=A0A0H2SSP7_9AGAM|nr:hypothetical protein SCHPADRAFT_31759 [Schizopora paradoxa]